MPLNIHALMQDAQERALLFGHLKDNVGGVFKAPEIACEVRRIAANCRIVRQSVKVILQAVEISLRLGQVQN